jgi:hypothetical protein
MNVIPETFMFTKFDIKTEIKLDINLLSKTNKYKTKQTNRKKKYQKEKKTLHECTFYQSDLVLIYLSLHCSSLE